MRPLILSFLLVLLVLPGAHALGLVPSSHETRFDPGAVSSYKLKIVNNDGQERSVLLSAEGDLAPLISLEQDTVRFERGERERIITVSLHQPSDAQRKGTISGRVVARESAVQQGQIAATLSVSSRLDLLVPYEGLYAESSLFVGELDKGRGSFVVEVRNLGEEDIARAQVFLRVFAGATNELVTSMDGGSQRIAAGEKAFFTIPWEAADKGSYRAVATTSYDGRTAEVEKNFVVGERSVAVDAITVDEFPPGGIAKLDLLLRNEWNAPLESVHAVIEVERDGRKYASSTTQSVDLAALGSKPVSAYWDTEGVVPGSYTLAVSVFHGQGVSHASFPITVKQGSIETGVAGRVVGAREGGEQGALYLLIILVLIVLVVNVALFRRLLRKK